MSTHTLDRAGAPAPAPPRPTLLRERPELVLVPGRFIIITGRWGSAAASTSRTRWSR